MKKIAIFASGEGTNAEAIARYFADFDTAQVALMICNRKEAGVYARMRALGIPAYHFPKAEWADGERVLELLRQQGVDLVVLAGFLMIIPPALLQAYPNRIVNIHPSLLPRHGGPGMWGHHVHQAVLDAGDTESGITIHYVSDKVDSGEIIFQAKCPVMPGDTPDTLAARVHALEHTHYPRVIASLLK